MAIAISIPRIKDTQDMAYLLSIPREVRDLVYDCLYYQCNSSTETVPPSDIERTTIAVSTEPFYGSIHYPTSYPKYSLLPILQVNQQIRQEFFEFLNRKSKRGTGTGIRYELDLYIPMTRVGPSPTWKTLPLPPDIAKTIEQLVIHFRVGHFNGRSSGMFYGCGGPGIGSYTLFRMLSDFFCHGPQWFYNSNLNKSEPREGLGGKVWLDGGRCQPFIQSMIFDVSFEYTDELKEMLEDGPSQGNEENETKSELLRRIKREEKYAITQGLGSWLMMLLDRGYFSSRVGKVVILLEGQEHWHEEYDYDTQTYVHDSREFSFEVEKGSLEHEWEPDQYIEGYSFKWGAKPSSLREHQLCSCKATDYAHLH